MTPCLLPHSGFCHAYDRLCGPTPVVIRDRGGPEGSVANKQIATLTSPIMKIVLIGYHIFDWIVNDLKLNITTNHSG